MAITMPLFSVHLECESIGVMLGNERAFLESRIFVFRSLYSGHDVILDAVHSIVGVLPLAVSNLNRQLVASNRFQWVGKVDVYAHQWCADVETTEEVVVFVGIIRHDVKIMRSYIFPLSSSYCQNCVKVIHLAVDAYLVVGNIVQRRF